MQLKSDNKKLNQYLIHADVLSVVESCENYEIAEIKRGRDCGIVAIAGGKVVESYMQDSYEWAKTKKEDNSHIDDIKTTYWMFFQK